MSGDVTAIVLAGGRSTRFGADKLAADLGGATVLERAIEAVAVVATGIILAGQPASPVPASGRTPVRIVPDAEPGGGPLRALAGALAATPTENALVVAGDMPSLVPAVLARLLETLRSGPDIDAVVLADPGVPPRRQPLPVALRAAAARQAATASVAAGDRSLVRLLDRLRVQELPVEQWRPLDPEARSLADIDVPDDLDRLRGGSADARFR